MTLGQKDRRGLKGMKIDKGIMFTKTREEFTIKGDDHNQRVESMSMEISIDITDLLIKRIEDINTKIGLRKR